MSTPVRLLAFAAVLAAVLLAGFGLGRAVGPVGDDAPADDPHGTTHSAPRAPGSPA